MSLIRYRGDDPWKALESLHDEFNKVFNVSLKQPAGVREEFFLPSIDLWDDHDNVYVETDLPGMEQKNIKVSVKGDVLTIAGKKENVQEEKKKNYYRCERIQGSVYRAVDLPTTVDPARVKANYKDGVLKITLPKREEEKEKQIDVRIE